MKHLLNSNSISFSDDKYRFEADKILSREFGVSILPSLSPRGESPPGKPKRYGAKRSV